MKKAYMICENCINSVAQGKLCKEGPREVETAPTNSCSKGKWHEWSEKYKEMEIYYWGEWEYNYDGTVKW